MPADARREPLPDAGHGPGRPPDGPPGEEPWAYARGFRSLFKPPQQNAAPPLPPLTASGLRGLHEDGEQDGGVHRLAVTSPGLAQANDSLYDGIRALYRHTRITLSRRTVLSTILLV